MCTLACAQSEVTLIATVHGSALPAAGKTLTVTEARQKLAHFHSDFEGGGTWYDLFFYKEEATVVLLERNSVSNAFETGSKVKTTEHLFRFPLDSIPEKPIELQLGYRVVLAQKQ